MTATLVRVAFTILTILMAAGLLYGVYRLISGVLSLVRDDDSRPENQGPMTVCTRCGHVGPAVEWSPGRRSDILVYGIALLVYRAMSSEDEVCELCGHPDVVPTASPKGQTLQKKFESHREPSNPDVFDPADRRGLFSSKSEPRDVVCMKCGSTAPAEEKMPGSRAMEVLLFLPTLGGYSMWRKFKYSEYCSVCGHEETMPAESPRAIQGSLEGD